MNNKEDILVSLKRTLVPIIIGAVGATIVGKWVDPQALENVVGSIIAGLYYTVLRVVESRYPAFGVLLGSKKQPVYVESVKE